MPSSRPSRMLAILVFVSMLTSLLPHAAAAAPTPLTAPTRTAPSVPTVLDEPPPGHRPAPAQSTITPASFADTVRNTVESTHQLHVDGTFSGPTQREMLTYATEIPIPIPDHGVSATVDLPLTIPAHAHDSFQVDIQTVPSYANFLYHASTAWVEIKPVTGTTWIASQGLFTGPNTNTSDPSPVTTVRRTLGIDKEAPTIPVPADVAIQIRLRCSTYIYGDGGSCRFRNFRFYDDAPGWERQDWGYNQWLLWDQWMGIVNEPVGSISPEDGPYFLFEKRHWDGSHAHLIYAGPRVQFPAINLAQSNVLTGTIRWAEDLIPGSELRGRVSINLRTDAGQEIPLAVVPERNSTSAHTGWVLSPALSINPASVSNQQGQLQIKYFPWSMDASRIGIDSFKLYLNGQSLPLSSPIAIPPDQNGGGCQQCTDTGSTSEVHGDPVNTRTGAFIERVSDMVVETGHESLVMDRSYSSHLTNPTQYPQSPLGFGWRFLYAEQLTLPTTSTGELGTLIYESVDGNRYRFYRRASGQFEAALGVRTQLTQIPTGYRLVKLDQSALEFDVQGRLVKRIDRFGHIQTITLGTQGVGLGLPVLVTDMSSGRTLTFAYGKLVNVNGTPIRLTTVTNGFNQSMVYTYDSDGHLTWVTNPQGTITRYETNTNHQIIGIAKGLSSFDTTASRRDLVNTYTNDRISLQVQRDGLQWRWTYLTDSQGNPVTLIQQVRNNVILDTQKFHYRLDGTLAWVEKNNSFVAYRTHDRQFGTAASVKANGQTTRQQTNGQGLVVASQETLLNGQPLVNPMKIQYTDLIYPQLITPTDELPITISYNANKQISQIQYGSTPATVTTYDPVTKNPQFVTDPNGLVTRYSYSAAGQISLVEVGFGTSAVQKTAYTYDLLGRVTDVTIGFDTIVATTTHTDYRPDGLVWKVTQNYRNGGTPRTATQNVVTEYGYDSYGRHVWTKGPDDRYRQVTSYDDAGRVRWVVDNALNGSGVPTVPALTGNPPAFSPSYPTGNIATLYGYDWLGRTAFVTQTGILTGTFNPSTLLWSGSTTRVTRTEYDALSRPVTITLNYRSDINGGQFSLQYPDVNVQTYRYYDQAGQLAWTRDALRRWTHIEYDALSRPVTTTLNYENGNPLTIDAANSAWASLADTDLIHIKYYDAHGSQFKTISNYVDGIQQPTIVNATLPWQITDTITDRTVLTLYDTQNRPFKTITNYVANSAHADLNHIQEIMYTPTGRVQARRDATGQWTVPQYDVFGRVTTSIQNCRNAAGVVATSNCGSQTSDRNVPTAESHYDVLGRVYQISETNGTLTRTAYDALGRVTSVTQNYQEPPTVSSSTINVVTTTTYADAVGLTVTTTDPTGRTTTTSANLDTGVTSITDPSGLITRIGPRWSKTPDGQVTVSMIDGLGRTIQTVSNYQDGVVTGADGSTRDLISRTRYDAADRIVATIDSLGTVTRYRYDLRDNLVQVVENADGSCSQPEASDCQLTTQYRYDRAGNQIAVINGRGITSRVMAYDALDQLRRQTDAVGNTTDTSYTLLGSVASVQPSGGSAITTSYDELGRPTSKTGASGASQTWTYDNAGRLATAFDASALNSATGKTGILTYNYDELNRVSGVQQSLADDPTAGNWTLGYSYDAAGRVTLIGGNSYGYDSAGRLQTIGRGGFTIAQYGYNSTTGWVETLTRSEAGASRAVETTLYDTLGRVSSITVGGATGSGATPTAQLAQFSYTYDRASRPVTFSEVQLNSSGTTVTENHSYGYDNVGRLASETAGSTTTGYGYDRAGNRVRVGSTTVSYLNNDRRSGWTYDAAGNVLNNGTQSYSYDGFNRPTTVTVGANSYTYRYHDESLVSRRTNGTLTHAYLTDRVGTPYNSLLRITNFAGADQYVTTYVSGLGGTILHQDQLKNGVNNGKSFLIGDAQHTVRMAINSTTGTRSTQDSDAWGKALTTPVSPIRYTGEFSDAQTGLVFLRARWYNPASGSFLSVDPFAGYAQQPLSLNAYQYGYNSPLAYTDPSGRCPTCDYGPLPVTPEPKKDLPIATPTPSPTTPSPVPTPRPEPTPTDKPRGGPSTDTMADAGFFTGLVYGMDFCIAGFYIGDEYHYDILDFEYATFRVGAFYLTTPTFGIAATAYEGYLSGWSNYTEHGIGNYTGNSVIVGIGGIKPLFISEVIKQIPTTTYTGALLRAIFGAVSPGLGLSISAFVPTASGEYGRMTGFTWGVTAGISTDTTIPNAQLGLSRSSLLNAGDVRAFHPKGEAPRIRDAEVFASFMDTNYHGIIFRAGMPMVKQAIMDNQQLWELYKWNDRGFYDK